MFEMRSRTCWTRFKDSKKEPYGSFFCGCPKTTKGLGLFLNFIWWVGRDSNPRRQMPTGLQPVPFGRSGTHPFLIIFEECLFCNLCEYFVVGNKIPAKREFYVPREEIEGIKPRAPRRDWKIPSR